MICLTAWARENIIWWLDLTQEECVLSLATAPIWKSIRVATDASDLVWGSVLAGQEVSEEWSELEIQHTIAHKEWMAFEFTVRRNRQVGQLACRQSERQACLHKPGHRQGRLVVQESCGTSLAAVRAPDNCCPRVRQVTASPSGRLPEQKESHSRLASGSKAVPNVRTASAGSDGLKPVISVADVLCSHARRGGNGRGQLGAGLGQVQPELCLTPTGHGGVGAEQDIPVQLLNSFPVCDPVEASSNMVSQSSVALNISSTQTSCQSLHSSRSSQVFLSSKHALWKTDEVRRVEAYWSRRDTSGGLFAGAQLIIQSGWAQGTKSVYGLGFRYFVQFCTKHKLDPLAPDPVNLLNFLTFYYETKKSEYRTLNCYRSAVSSTLAKDPKTGLPVGQDPLVSRFFSRCTQTAST
jgi:hypothetical protein